MQSDVAIRADGLSKCYHLFDKPGDRLKQLLWGRWHHYGRDFWALRDVSFEIPHGEVVGLVGRNGAGKSTLLQMVCGTLQPTSGSLQVNGRVAALLELGAGFSPEFSGLENVYMNAAILGMPRADIDARLDDILRFADIGRFIHQPVKTYSSGMFVRLAFAVATSVDPDILVIDEALSVGDGAFARKSFDRIMTMRDKGATILFCSHAMYHVQALCSRAIWMQDGRVRMQGSAANVSSAYETALVVESESSQRDDHAISSIALKRFDAKTSTTSDSELSEETDEGAVVAIASTVSAPAGTARIVQIEATADGYSGRELAIHCGQSSLQVSVTFAIDPSLVSPSVAVCIVHENGHLVSSAGTVNDGVKLHHDVAGIGTAVITFEKLALLRGDYRVDVYLACERGLHSYEFVQDAVRLRVVQTGLAQGYVALPHQWSTSA
jgi:lipopolysaccharide transport system ATP-binding protein